MSPNRIDYIDIAKGLGMLAIIWGHIMLYGWSCKMVCGFHIPLFFMLSGMCFNPDKYHTLGELIKRRVRTLLVPYVVFSVATWMIYLAGALVLHNDTMSNCWYYLLQTLLAQGSDGYLKHNVALWFVPCLFVVNVLYYLVSRHAGTFNIFICLLCATAGVLMSSRYYDFTFLPWSIDSALVAMSFFAFGNLFVKRFSHAQLIQWVDNNVVKAGLVTTILTVFYLMAVQKNGYISMGHNYLGSYTWLFFINAFMGSISIILLSLLLGSLLKHGGLHPFTRFVRWLGRNSFNAMATHLPVRSCLLVLFAMVLHTGAGSDLCSSISIALVVYMATLLVTSLVILMINKGKQLVAKKD